MLHVCTSLGWYRPGQQGRGLQRLLVVLCPSAVGAGYLPLLKYSVLFPTKCFFSSSSLRLGERSQTVKLALRTGLLKLSDAL